MVRPILKLGAPALQRPTAAVADFAGQTQQIIDDMIETMHAAPGIGLAAPQLDVPLRLFVVDLSVGRTASDLQVFINPEIVERDGMQLEEEGCLSVPGFTATVLRPARVVVRALDRDGREQNGRGHGVAGPRAPARDGSPRRPAVCAAPARHAACVHRAARPPTRAARPMVTHAPLRVVFFGTPEFAVPTVAALLASRHPLVGVVTQPDRPRGRGHQVSASPVKSLALERGVPVLQPEKMRDEAFLAALRAFDADLGVVAAYGRILTDAILAIPRLGMVNVHASLLPRWRGAAPIHRAILAGDTETGVTIMRVVRELDAGPMMATLREPIGPIQTTGEVERILATRGAQLLGEVVERMAEGPLQEDPQPSTGVTYADRITKADAPIFWWRPAGEIHNQVRALNPWPLASTSLDGARLLVVATDAGTEAAPAGALPGTVLAAKRRPLRRRGRPRHGAVADRETGGQARDGGARVSCRPPGPARRRAGMIAPARRVALDALSGASAGADLPDVLARTRDQLADERDRALAAAIVIGTLRWRRRLDFHLQQAISRNLDKLDAIVLEVLRLSLFQILFLERVPAAAVVDDAVSLVRRGGKTSAGGFVNGVLRTISRTRDRLPCRRCPRPSSPQAIATSPLKRSTSLARIRVGWWPGGSIGSGSMRPTPGLPSTTSKRR